MTTFIDFVRVGAELNKIDEPRLSKRLTIATPKVVFTTISAEIMMCGWWHYFWRTTWWSKWRGQSRAFIRKSETMFQKWPLSRVGLHKPIFRIGIFRSMLSENNIELSTKYLNGQVFWKFRATTIFSSLLKKMYFSLQSIHTLPLQSFELCADSIFLRLQNKFTFSTHFKLSQIHGREEIEFSSKFGAIKQTWFS